MESPRGTTPHERLRCSEGLDVAKQTRASGGGRKMFLTSPFIDPFIEQALSQLCAFCSPDMRKESANLCYGNFRQLKRTQGCGFPVGGGLFRPHKREWLLLKTTINATAVRRRVDEMYFVLCRDSSTALLHSLCECRGFAQEESSTTVPSSKRAQGARARAPAPHSYSPPPVKANRRFSPRQG